ncbi:hypothetical protein C7212DRAFT_344578 [Tuber magnatum]|uniref:Uncharacterized protein n=1 Tax=Tuber magnatum TaxID=42249 RepID=A0A317SNU6_9PEZI|nr:hypothetical protein C7212DRAFT_344578 [Tuber magnatum]
MLFNSISSLLVLGTTLVAAVPAPIAQRSSGCASGLSFTGQAGCSQCTTEGNVVCGRDEDRTTDLKCTRFSTGLTWVPVDNPGKCGVSSTNPGAYGEYTSTCPSGKPFTGQAGCSTCSTEGNIVCGRDEDAIADLKCTRFSTGLVWVPVKNPGKCGVDYKNLKARGESSCPSGKPFTGQAGCSTCSTRGNIVCGRDEDAIADLKCTRFSTGLVWVPVKNPGKCGVDSTNLKARAEPASSCPSGKPFTGQAGCSTCSTRGNIVCGRDEDAIADLKCTRFSTGLVWVPVKNPGKCGVDSTSNSPASPSPSPATCASGKPFTGQAGCSTCSTVNNVVCGRDEDRTTDLRCTRRGNMAVWIPIDNQGACGVSSSAPAAPSTCPSGKPFTGQAGCSRCSTVNNIVCGRDEDRVTDLKCTAFGSSLSWVPVDNPGKCGV